MLAGKIAIVTGAGSGLGQACAVALAREGATTVITELPDRHDKAEETLAMVEAAFRDTTLAEVLAEPTSSHPLCEVPIAKRSR